MKHIIFLSIYLFCFSCKKEDVLANESMNVSITPRIIGGEDADMRVHSYTLSLRFKGEYFCSACGISAVGVLSAAHCFLEHPKAVHPYLDVTVHSGTASPEEIGTIHLIERVMIHPGFTGSWDDSKVHDIAYILLKEKTKLKIDQNQRKLDLPRNDVVADTSGIITGWGCKRNVKNGEPAQRLQMLKMQILANKECELRVKPRILHKEQLCTIHKLSYGCANGDSGGPFVIGNEIVGIHSWSRSQMGGAAIAAIFTNVFQEKSFIQAAIQGKRGQSCSSQQSKVNGKQIDVNSSKKKWWCFWENDI